MQRCARAVIEYDGTAFAGSQYQPNARTVQGELEEALNRLTGERIRVRFAGRTDAGVHATGQVAAFCLQPRPQDEAWHWPVLQERLNGLLPGDLAVRSLRSASAGFDPRRDAVTRIYRYRIRMAGERRPTDRHRTLEIDDRLDVAAMRRAAAALPGERDFAALGSDRHGRTVRRVTELIEAGRGRLDPTAVEALLAARGRALSGRAAPARGLTLERVIYSNTGRARTSVPRRHNPEADQEEQQT